MAVDIGPIVVAVGNALDVPQFAFYDGYVPERVPEAGGHILPYVVLYAGDGSPVVEEVTADGLQPVDTLVWDFQITAVGATSDVCRRVAQDVRRLLTNLRAGTGRIKPNPDGFNQQVPYLDPSVTPARFILPLQWRLNTN
jgi:hypothetical protein